MHCDFWHIQWGSVLWFPQRDKSGSQMHQDLPRIYGLTVTCSNTLTQGKKKKDRWNLKLFFLSYFMEDSTLEGFKYNSFRNLTYLNNLPKEPLRSHLLSMSVYRKRVISICHATVIQCDLLHLISHFSDFHTTVALHHLDHVIQTLIIYEPDDSES